MLADAADLAAELGVSASAGDLLRLDAAWAAHAPDVPLPAEILTVPSFIASASFALALDKARTWTGGSGVVPAGALARTQMSAQKPDQKSVLMIGGIIGVIGVALGVLWLVFRDDR